jgi:hypothetical protein
MLKALFCQVEIFVRDRSEAQVVPSCTIPWMHIGSFLPLAFR